MYKYFFAVFLFLCSVLTAQEDFRIISSSQNSIIVEFTPIYIDTSLIKSNFENFRNTIFKNANFIDDSIGMPQFPVRIFNFGVPNEFGNNIRVLSSNYKILKGNIRPIPDVKKTNGFSQFVYSKSKNYNNFKDRELVTFGEFGKVRELDVQEINVNPVQFDVNNNEIKFFTKIIFQVDFSTNNRKKNSKVSEISSNLVINKEESKYWGEEQKLGKKSAQQSVLAEGNWYRFEAPIEGIYKIDKAYLSELGIPVSSIDPKTIKIYNNGGYNLSWEVTQNRPADLTENAIFVSGEQDGSFGDSDYILFYGRGVDFWEFNSISNKIIRNKHFYSKKNYYWLTYGGESGKRMSAQASNTLNATLQQNSTIAYKFKDDDNQNLISSGLLYIDDDYTNSVKSKTYTNMLNELIADSVINYTFQFVNGSTVGNVLTIEENNNRIFSKTLAGSASYLQEYRYGTLTRNITSYKGSLPSDRSVLKFTFNPSKISDKGHLDFLEIEYYKRLNAVDGELLFYSNMSDNVIQYTVNGFEGSDIKLFNITDFSTPNIINPNITGGSFVVNTLENSSSRSKYFAVHSNKYRKPAKGIKIENSNIRGFSPGAKYVVITPKDFLEQAERLKNYRTTHWQFPTTSKVVTIDQLYNEFSGGLLDPTAIRDFLKYAYENWEIKPEYILLFGDGDFDYFNVEGKGKNFIPTFQKAESLFEIDSYPYDDYYCRISGNDSKADLAIGRLSVTTIQEAKIVVDKIINYETQLNKGLWRNRITLLADDGLAGFNGSYVEDDGNTHTRQSEDLSINYIPQNFDRNKMYLSNYQTINTGLGRRKPDCNLEVINSINNGTLIFNYIGHGNPDVWAHEIVFDRSISIPQLRNKELFFLTAATCDFGKYDDPNLQSATEEMILMDGAGMIGGLSAVRPVFSSSNADLNNDFYSFMLGTTDSLGFPPPIGDAYFKLKAKRSNSNDEKFHLFCDPMLRLNIPKLPLRITSVNKQDLSQTINIKALSEVVIEGKVLNAELNQNAIDGEGIITVFDSKRTVRLEDINYNMEEQGGVIFRGRVSVDNGEFSTSFTVPKDISYENKNGKIVAYFFNNDLDGIGFTDRIIVGGTDSSNVNDGKGPDINILYDDETESSYLVNPNFKLRVKLFDETGLNTTGTGIGHKLEAILNEDEQNSIDLTNYFIGDLNSGGKSGEIIYNFSALSTGEYKIKINAWDVFNNFSSRENFFTVVDENNLVVREVYNYPNPFSANTYFTFQHNLNNDVNVKIKVYTIAGRVIKVIDANGIDEKFVKIEWDGKDDDNNKIANGTYLYKLLVETTDGKYKENILGKMAVIR